MGNRGDTQISPEVEEFLGEFWELLGYIANTCIFTLTGVIIVYNDMWVTIGREDFLKSGLIYCSIMIIRFLVFKGLTPIVAAGGAFIPVSNDMRAVPPLLSLPSLCVCGLFHAAFLLCSQTCLAFRMPYTCAHKCVSQSPAETYICCWGALRGAVGLALGLVVWGNKQSKGGLVDDAYADRILFHAAMIVIITLLFNATTVAPLLKYLELDKVDELKDKLFRVSMEEIKGAGEREIDSLKLDELISCASWPDVRKFGTVEQKNKRVKDDADEMNKAISGQKSGLDNAQDDERSFRKHLTELRELRESRRRCLAAVKASYRNQFRHGMLSRRALHFLENLTEKMLDNNCELNEWNEISAGHLFSKIRRRKTPVMRYLFKSKDFSNLQVRKQERAAPTLVQFQQSAMAPHSPPPPTLNTPPPPPPTSSGTTLCAASTTLAWTRCTA